MNDQHIFSKYGGTRFIATIGCGFVSALLLRAGDLTGEEFVEITKWTVSVFIAGNAGQNIFSFFSNKKSQQQNNEAVNDGTKQH